MKDKLKDLIHSKYFIPILCCIPLALVVLSALLVLMWYVFLAEAFIWTVGFVKLYWRTMLAIPGVILGFFAVIRYVLPVVIYFFGRIGMYISLWVLCLKKGYRLKLCRAPFASLAGVHEKPDFTVTTTKEIMAVHIVDFVFRFRRVVLFSADGEYHVIPTTSTGATLVGAALGSVFSDEPVELTNQKRVLLNIVMSKKRQIPDFSADRKMRHIVMMQTNPVDARFDSGTENYEISSGTKVGSAEFYYLKRLKKELK